MPAHVIRLHGPWECEPLARLALNPQGSVVEIPGPLPTAGVYRPPSDWGNCLGSDFRGRVRFRRAFHWLTTLGAGEEVWLCLAGIDARGAGWLNDESLGPTAPWPASTEWNLTTRLRPRNQLTLEVEVPEMSGANAWPRPGRADLPGGIVGEVRLEIRTATAP